MRAARHRWAVALRIARRGPLKSWGRSLLVMALIGIPVAALTGAAVLIPSTQSTLDERIANTLGHAQARITVVATPADHVQQGVEGGYDYTTNDSLSQTAKQVDPQTVLPGVRMLSIGTGAATFRTAAGATSIAVTTGPSWDPSLDGGPYQLLSGRRPAAADQVLLSPAALTRLGAHVGGTIAMLQPSARTLTVVGTARDRSAASDTLSVFGAASLLPGDVTPQDLTYYVPSAPIDWAQVQQLNRAGATVFSRQVVLHPPVLPQSLRSGGGGGALSSLITIIAIGGLFTTLEVALLAGAAFAVGARLQQRMLATIASVGGDRRILRRVVTASGIVLGTAGGAAGIVVGVVGAIVLMQITGNGSWERYPGLHIEWPLLAGILVFAVLVGWISALVPARAAGKIDVVRALRGARSPQRVGRTPVLGVLMLIAGIVLTIVGGGVLLAVVQSKTEVTTLQQLGAIALVGGGPVIAQLGVLLCAGLVLRGVSRLLASAPLPARIAARDTSRNLGRAVPAVAAVMTTVFLAAFTMCIANTASIDSAKQYSWASARIGQGQTSVVPGTSAKATGAAAVQVVDALRHDLPVTRLSVLGMYATDDSKSDSNKAADAMPYVHFPSMGYCTDRSVEDLANMHCGPFSANGGRFNNADSSAIMIGDAAGLAMLLGQDPSAAAVSTLDSGGTVVLRGDLAPGGTATLDWYTPKHLEDKGPEGTPVRTTKVQAVVDLPAHPLRASIYMTAATAARLHIAQAPSTVLFDLSRTPTDRELDTANAALGAIANQPDGQMVSIETGPTDYGSLIAWWILVACLLVAISAGATAIGLARVDGRADDVTLAAIGAPPVIRRHVALVQALIICGVGAVIGTLLGMLPAAAIGQASESYAFAPPPLQLVLTAIGIPIVIGVGSWLIVGRRTDLARRVAM